MSDKNKKRSIWAVALVLLVAVVVAVLAFVGNVNLSKNAKGEFYYTYLDIDIYTTLTDEESATIAQIIDGKKLVYDPGLMCGFDDNIYISFDDNGKVKNFYPVCDGCTFLRYNDKHIVLSKQEMETIREILAKYGAIFPCV